MKRISRRIVLSGIVSLALLTFTGPAQAACTMPDNPPGTPVPDAQAGDLVYNIDDDVMQYCDGDEWNSAAGGGGGLPTCSNGYLLRYNTASSTWACTNPASIADNLGNHTATQNVRLGAYWLSGDGGNEGITVDSAGNVGVGVTPSHKLHVNGNIGVSTGAYINFGNTSGSGGYGIRDNAGTIECKNSGGSWVACAN